MPAAMPMQSEPRGPTKPDAGVMATRPAMAPVQMPTTVGLPRIIHSTSIQVNAAVAVAICVTSMAMPACMPAVTAEPALKPNQPTHNSEAPMKVSTMLWLGPVSLRLPRTRHAISPATPELMCTTVPPAKSRTLTHASAFAAARNPSGPQTQCALGERARDQRRGDDGEGQLEADVDRLGNGRRQRIGIADALGYVAHDALQEGAVEPSDERGSRSECQAVGDDQPENADQTGDGETRHHGVAHVLLADHAAVGQAETWYGHHQN